MVLHEAALGFLTTGVIKWHHNCTETEAACDGSDGLGDDSSTRYFCDISQLQSKLPEHYMAFP